MGIKPFHLFFLFFLFFEYLTQEGLYITITLFDLLKDINCYARRMVIRWYLLSLYVLFFRYVSSLVRYFLAFVKGSELICSIEWKQVHQ
jgi:hypothetical protein